MGNPHQEDKRWPRPLSRGSRLKRVLFTVFPDNNLGTLITSCSMRDGRLTLVRLYNLLWPVRLHRQKIGSCN